MVQSFLTVHLKTAREKSVLRRHPWIFSGAIQSSPDGAGPWVQVKDSAGAALAFGLYSPKSQIRVRVWSFGSAIPDIDRMLMERFQAAKSRRAALLSETDAVRYVNGEGDFMPGIFLDKYAATLVLQIQTEGAERIRERIIHTVQEIFDEPVLYEKSVGRPEEGLPDRAEVVYGDGFQNQVQIRHGKWKFWVDIASGHKTGGYLDQRRNVGVLREFLEKAQARRSESRLLDCFCYSGVFGVSLKDMYGRVVFVDTSPSALKISEKNWLDNAGNPSSAEFISMDAFRYLREPAIGPFDAVILDPPSFAKRKGEVEGACRGYKDIQRLAMKALRPGGYLAVFCCSHHVDADLFQKVCFAAAIDAGRPAQILARLGADVDHPVSIDHPEGDYLKGFLLRVE